MLTLQELRSSTKKELLAELKDVQRQLLQIRITVRTKNQKDTSLVRKQKRYAAKVKTVLRELELEEIVQSANEIKS